MTNGILFELGDYNESICAYNKAIDLNPLDESAITERDLAIDSNSPKLVICQIGRSERTVGGRGGPEETGGSPKPQRPIRPRDPPHPAPSAPSAGPNGGSNSNNRSPSI